MPASNHIETWRTIPAFKRYEASDLGRIRRKEDGMIVAQRTNKHGYVNVNLRIRKGFRKTAILSRAVYSAFNGPIPAGLAVNHIDGNKSNNVLSNLEAITNSENARHAYRIGLRSNAGENNPRAKFTADQIKSIRAGKRRPGYVTSVANEYGVTDTTVSRILNGKHWKCA
jgi:hypothetical protein